MMKKISFDLIWVGQIMECVKSVSYTWFVSGKPSRKLLLSRGLRQGVLFSAYVFLFVIDVLSRKLINAVQSSQLSRIRLNMYCPILTEIFFVDDSLFFVESNPSKCMKLFELIQEYCDALKKLMKQEKLVMMFSANASNELEDQIKRITSVRVVDNLQTYIGIPALWSKTRMATLTHI